MPTPLSTLIIEDRESDAQLVVRLLKKADYEVAYEQVDSAEQVRAALEKREWDIIISDYKMPQFDGFAALKIVQEMGLDTPFILVSGTISQETAIEIMIAGAQDYLDKNDLSRLIPVVKREIKQAEIRRQRKQAEDALLKSEERYRSLFEDSPIAIWEEDFSLVKTQFDRLRQAGVTDFRAYWKEHPEDFRTLADLIQILQINQACIKALSAENKEQVINNFSYYFTEESLIIFEDEMVALAEGQTQFKSELPVRNWLGERVVFDLTLCVQRGCEDNLARVLVSVLDITERKKAEEALLKSEEQYRNLINLLPSGIVVHNKGVIVLANNASSIFFGAENPQQLIGTALIDRVHPDYRETVHARVMKALDADANAPLVEEKLLRLDDSSFDAEVAAIPINYAGETSVLAIFNDISERKQAEEELRKHLMELEAVHTVSKALRTAQVTEEALPLLLDQTLAAMGADTAAIWLYHPVNDDLRIAVTRGWFGEINEPPLKPGQGIAGKVFATGKMHVTRDFASDPITHFAPGAKIPSGWGGVCAPILSDEQMIGVVFVSVPLPREITPDEIKLLSSLTEMTGAALYRMRLHEETVQRLKNLQAFHEIDQAISASFDLSIIFDILLTHVVNQLNVDAAAVLLFHPYKNFLEYAAKRGFRARSNQPVNIPLNGSPAGNSILERRNIQIFDISASLEKDQLAALWAGEGFNAYIGVPLIVKGEIKGVLEVFSRKTFTPNPEWIEFLNTLAGQAAIAISDTQLFDNLQHANQELSIAYDATIEGWSHALDLRDKETEGHTLRVTGIASKLALKMGMAENDLLHFRRGAILHDIGKMGVPDHILLKPGKLTAKEKNIIQQHAQFAYDMLHPIKYLYRALDIPYCHHEKWDGKGYPRGLKGEQIPLGARIFAIVDVWDALTSDRPYRKAWTKAKARKYIIEESGTHFDPQVVEKFIEMLDTLE